MPNPNRGSCGFQSSEFEQEYERPSKTEMKRQSDALQALGAPISAETFLDPTPRRGIMPI